MNRFESCSLSVLAAATFGFSVVAAESPRLIIDPRGPSGEISEVLFTSEGETLISLGRDKAIRFWDVASGALRRTIRLEIGDGPEGMFYAGALSSDDRWLAVGGFDRISPDDRWLAEGGFDGSHTIRIIDTERGNVAAVLRGNTGVVSALDFSEDGVWLASGGEDSSVRLWDLSDLPGTSGLDGNQPNTLDLEPTQVLDRHDGEIYTVRFSPDGDRLLSGDLDKKLCLWRKDKDGRFAYSLTMEGHREGVMCSEFSSDGSWFVSGGADDQILLWNGEDGTLVRELVTGLGQGVSTIALSPDGSFILASAATGYTAIYSVSSGEKLTSFEGHNSTVTASAWHPTEDLVATAGGEDHTIQLWRPKNGESVQHFSGHGRSNWSVAFSENVQAEVAFGWTNNLEENTPQTFSAVRPLQKAFNFESFTLSNLPESTTDPPGFRRHVHHRNGHNLAYAGDYFHLDTGSGIIEYDVNLHDRILSFSFTSSGEVIVGSDFFLELHEPNGEFIGEFVGHTGGVRAVSPSPDDRYLVSASLDQTLRLWSLETGELLATLFVSRESEWICWTPSGHYHASAGGEKYIGWYISQGPGRVADYHPAYVFREQFHHPELVKRTVLLGDFDKALAEVGETVAPAIADVLPPQIDWIFPAKIRGRTPGTEVTIRANISSPKAELEEVKLLINGKAVETDFRVSGNSLNYEKTITLQPGENSIAIFARNRNSGHISDERSVTVALEQNALSGGKALPIAEGTIDDLLKPNLYVLSVGVSDYMDEAIPALNYCDDDASAIAAFFEKQAEGIFGEAEVKLLVNDSASEGGIQDGLDWLEDNATQKDFVVLFLAAHGLNDEKGNFYLLPHDANPNRLRSTGVSWDDFGDILGNLPSRVLMLLDTCHSGRLGANLFKFAGVEGAKTRSVGGLKSAFDPTEAIRELTSEENGVVIMAASTGAEESVEHDDWGHGAFTMGLLDGFGGKADVNGDGIIHLRELDFFVSDRVKELTGGIQHPTTVKPSTISRLPVALVK